MTLNEETVIAVLGDTHGNKVPLEEIVTKIKPNFIIHTGDYTNTEVDDDNYIQYLKDLNLTYGQNIANSQGNHESKEESGEGAQRDMEAAYPILKENEWLQFYHINNIALIIGNTQALGYSQLDSNAGKWLKDLALPKAKQLIDSGQADFIFYIQHKPPYTLKARHESEFNFRYNFHPLFDQYGVDIVCNGHNHDGSRTLPLLYGGPANAPPKINNKIKNGAHDLSVIPHGTIFTINGSSTKLTPYSESPNAWTPYANDKQNSYTVYKIKGKTLTGQFIEIGTGKVLHEFKASKEETIIAGPPPGGPPPPTQPPPPTKAPGPGYRWHPELKKWIPVLEHPSFLKDHLPDTKVPTPPAKPIPSNPADPKGEIDQMGIKWLVAKGKQSMIEQTRDEADDDRWSGNVTGLKQGAELTMIAKSTGVASDGHFALKHGGGNHSKGDWQNQRWYDTGLRSDGSVQLQYEGPHPKNHDFELPGGKLLIKNIGKPLEGNYYIGLKWIVQALTPEASPSKGGIHCRMYVDKDAIGPDGKPKNNWELVYDFIDGKDAQVIKPQDYVLPDEWDCEIRKSGTKSHQIYGGGLFVRAL